MISPNSGLSKTRQQRFSVPPAAASKHAIGPTLWTRLNALGIFVTLPKPRESLSSQQALWVTLPERWNGIAAQHGSPALVLTPDRDRGVVQPSLQMSCSPRMAVYTWANLGYSDGKVILIRNHSPDRV